MVEVPGPDWRLLAPHRPLSQGDKAYVPRPTSGGNAIAAWILAGGSTVLVSGPTGIGKSTELAQAARELKSGRLACLAQVDRLTNIHRLVAGTLLYLLAQKLVDRAQRSGLQISQDLTKMVASGVDRGTGMAAARAAVDEIGRLVQPLRIAFLIDGLEKLFPSPVAREIFDALSQLSESVDLIVVIPGHAAFGGGTEPILRGGERLHRVAVIDTEGEAAVAAEDFFRRVLEARLRVNALPDQVVQLLGTAVRASGGIPRVFLQLMADAGTYARVKRGADWPDDSDLNESFRDQQDSFRRALLPGDTAAIERVAGTDGRELDLERRLRLIAQGILLERARGGRVSLVVHPLVVDALEASTP
jgi:hypothetical protein